MDWINLKLNSPLSVQSSLGIFAQKYLRKYGKYKDAYFILQNKYIFAFTKIVFEQRYSTGVSNVEKGS